MSEVIGEMMAEFDENEDGGVELRIPEEVTEALGLEEGDSVTVSRRLDEDGNVKLEVDFDGDFTDEEIERLKSALS